MNNGRPMSGTSSSTACTASKPTDWQCQGAIAPWHNSEEAAKREILPCNLPRVKRKSASRAKNRIWEVRREKRVANWLKA
jgi:hypothetical protein